MMFFGIVSLLLLIISLILGIPVLAEYFMTGMVPRFPTLVVAGFLIIAAILTLVCGIILQVVVRKQRETFEVLLTQSRKD